MAKRLTGCSPGQQPLRLLLASITLNWASFYELSPPVCSQSSLGLPHSFFLSTSHCHCLFASLSHQLSCEILGGRDWMSYVMASMDRCSIKIWEWMNVKCFHMYASFSTTLFAMYYTSPIWKMSKFEAQRGKMKIVWAGKELIKPNENIWVRGKQLCYKNPSRQVAKSREMQQIV